MHLGVLHVRDTLIAWYERRGYRKTEESEPWPSEDSGTPLVENCAFCSKRALDSSP